MVVVDQRRTFVGPDGTESAYRIFDPDQMPLQERIRLVRQYGGHTLAYSAAHQSGLRHFGNKNGFLAFQKKFGYVFVLGDPIAAPSRTSQIIDEFLRHFPNAAFCQISDSTAEILQERKYWINEIGTDIQLDLQSYDFNGKTKERFRYAANWLKRRDFTIRELEFNAATQEMTRQLGSNWRETRSVKKETAFLNRPLEYGDQPDMRRFFLMDQADQPVAFVFFDPIFDSGKIVGYVTSFKRRDPSAPSMAEQGICKLAIEQFKSEGLRFVKLGLSPFASIDDGKFKHNFIMKRSFRYLFNAWWVNRFFYNLKGHASFKEKFRGEIEKTYFASPSFVNDLRLIALFRLCKIL